MFNNISWQGYWTTLAIITAVYYLIVYFLYYRNDLSPFWNRKSVSDEHGNGTVPKFNDKVSEGANKVQNLPASKDSGDFAMPPKDTEEYTVYACMDELKAFFEASETLTIEKKTALVSLQALLSKYPSLKFSEYKASITNVIVTECEHNCSIHLDDDDLVHVWFGWSE